MRRLIIIIYYAYKQHIIKTHIVVAMCAVMLCEAGVNSQLVAWQCNGYGVGLGNPEVTSSILPALPSVL